MTATLNGVSMRETLGNPNDTWLHPDLKDNLWGLNTLITRLEESGGAIPEISELGYYEAQAVEWLDGLSRWAGGRAIQIPFLSEQLCRVLVGFAEENRGAYAVNDEEREQYQIDECVLAEHFPDLHLSLLTLAQNSIFKAVRLLWGRSPTQAASIQLARYAPDGIVQTDWHLDTDSDTTLVINLEPEAYTGGGTWFRTGVMSAEFAPPTPAGHALLFNGRHYLHRGAAVETGVRHLLVYWCNSDT